jgi:hypothetical protein
VKKIAQLSLAVCLLGSIVSTPALSQRASGIEIEKQELIKQLIVLTNVEQITRQSIDMMLTNIESELPTIFDSASRNMPAKRREEYRAKMRAEMPRFINLYRKMFYERFDFQSYVEQLSYYLYNKYYTLDELRDLTSFYSSSTGQKMIIITPQLLNDSIRITYDLMRSKQEALLLELLQSRL